jgi:hypothetical protein
VYDPRIAAPVWIVLITAFLFDRRIRFLIRPSLTVLAIFVLLLANFAQLQPGTPETRSLFERIPPAIEAVQRFRVPAQFVSGWESRVFLLYLATAVLGVFSLLKQWPKLSPLLRWLFASVPLLGLLGVPTSYVFLDLLHLRAALLLHPERALLFTAVFVAILCIQSALQSQTGERWLFAAGPLLLIIASWRPLTHHPGPDTAPAANWALNNTWGASTFLFADAGDALVPGRFRAQATRAVWTDWETGQLCTSSDVFADEWQRRWRDTMQGSYSLEKLRRFLTMPIDYYVLSARNRISSAKPVYADANWLIYDAHDLRSALPLHH